MFPNVIIAILIIRVNISLIILYYFQRTYSATIKMSVMERVQKLQKWEQEKLNFQYDHNEIVLLSLSLV